MEELETPIEATQEPDSTPSPESATAPEPHATTTPEPHAAEPAPDAPVETDEIDAAAPPASEPDPAAEDESPAPGAEIEAGVLESEESLSVQDLLPTTENVPFPIDDVPLRAVLEAVIYVADEPLALPQIAAALGQPVSRIQPLLNELIAEFDQPDHGIAIREVAGGYKIATKPEHHEAVRSFVKSLKPPLKLSLPALETLAVIAYKQPVTAPEIMEVRGVQGAGVLKTLIERKLIATAGRKNVIGKPILYKTTKEFLIQFGLKDLSELPSLKEFEEIRRLALADSEPAAPLPPPDAGNAAGPGPVPSSTAAEQEPPQTASGEPPETQESTGAPEPASETTTE